MTDRKPTHIAASVRQRLLNRARAEGRVFQELATLYAMERFLYRLGRSPHAERFVLKGGLMTLTWAGEYARLTRDIDLLGRGASTVHGVVDRVREVLSVEADDGLRFNAGSASGREITADAAHELRTPDAALRQRMGAASRALAERRFDARIVNAAIIGALGA